MASCILVIICSGNGLSPVRHQTFYSSNADFLPVNEMLIEVRKLSSMKMHMKCCVQNFVHFALVSKSL